MREMNDVKNEAQALYKIQQQHCKKRPVKFGNTVNRGNNSSTNTANSNTYSSRASTPVNLSIVSDGAVRANNTRTSVNKAKNMSLVPLANAAGLPPPPPLLSVSARNPKGTQILE